MKIPAVILLFFLLLLHFSCKQTEGSPDLNQKLWYNYPAKYWNSQALRLGNGYFGVSFFGGVEHEKLSLSEKSMWTGSPAEGDWQKAGVNPRAKDAIPKIREAVVEGNGSLADKLIAEDVFGSSEEYGFFTSIGDLNIDFENHSEEPSEYYRELDLMNSLGKVRYKLGNTTFKREYFCSYPDRVLGMKFTSSRPGQVSFQLSVDVMQHASAVEINKNTFRLKGSIDGNNRPFEVLINIKNDGGEISSQDGKLIVKNADAAELFLTMATNYKMEYPSYTGDDPEITTTSVMKNAVAKGYEGVRTDHIQDYQSLYNRVKFELPANEAIEKLPANERFQQLKSGMPDPGYKVLAFNLGRYLIISSSRPKTLPANLQGVWNSFYVAPWAGNYQSNINLQEIYWSCGNTNLQECQEAYINWIENLAVSGKEVAKRVYGTNGWISHTTGNIWGHAAPIGDHPWGMYSMGSAWHCQHVWDQYAFNQDREYLENHAWPLLREASVFWLENLIPFKGYLITAPTVSAEHGALETDSGLNPAFHDFKSDKYVYSLPGVYQDMEMIWDLFTNTSKAAKLVGETAFADSLLKVREKLLPLKTGKHGQLQEWYRDIDDPECHHRHIAHLYAVCPGNEIYPTTTPELAKAAKKSLNMRGDGRYPEQELASGGNWARAHRMWCWTRLLDGNRANKIMTEMLTEQGFENGLTYQHADYSMGREDFYREDNGLFCHFQLDGSAALPGCIAEMIMQSHMDEIHLLPALPDEFKTGKISGIKARGNYTVDVVWKEGNLEEATIFCPDETRIPVIRLKGKIISPASDERIKLVYL